MRPDQGNIPAGKVVRREELPSCCLTSNKKSLKRRKSQ